jgi:SSS family solute:Na+ symporter
MKINTLAAIVIPAYILSIMVSLFLIGRKVKNYKDFALGGGTLPWYVVAASATAATIGGGTIIGYVGSYYNFGMQWAWMGICATCTSLYVGLFIAQRVRKLNQYTVPDMFALRYGDGTRMITAVLIIMGDFAVFCASLASFSAVLSGYVGLSAGASLLISAIIFMICANLGGMKGLAWTDLIQTILILGGILLVGAIAFFSAGGFKGISSLGSNMTSLFAANIPVSKMVGNIVALCCMTFVSQSLVMQKINSAKNPEHAKKAFIASSIAVGIAIVFCISSMGLSSKVLFGEGLRADNVITTLLNSMPPVIAAIYCAAIVAAILTTGNAMLISSSMNLSVDIVKRFNKNIDDKKLMLCGRIYILAAGILGYVLVKFRPDVISWIILCYTIQSCLIVPLYGGLLFKKPNNASGTCSLLFAGLSMLIWEMLKQPFGIHSAYIAIGTGIIGIFFGLVISKKQATAEQIAAVDAFRNNQEYKVGSGMQQSI